MRRWWGFHLNQGLPSGCGCGEGGLVSHEVGNLHLGQSQIYLALMLTVSQRSAPPPPLHISLPNHRNHLHHPSFNTTAHHHHPNTPDLKICPRQLYLRGMLRARWSYRRWCKLPPVYLQSIYATEARIRRKSLDEARVKQLSSLQATVIMT